MHRTRIGMWVTRPQMIALEVVQSALYEGDAKGYSEVDFSLHMDNTLEMFSTPFVLFLIAYAKKNKAMMMKRGIKADELAAANNVIRWHEDHLKKRKDYNENPQNDPESAPRDEGLPPLHGGGTERDGEPGQQRPHDGDHLPPEASGGEDIRRDIPPTDHGNGGGT